MSAFNGSGTFVISGTGLPYVTATTISSTVANQLNTDLATGLSTCITKDGQTTPTANIPMGSFKLTGVALATATGDALSYGRAATVTTLSGTTITATGTITPSQTNGIVGTTTNNNANAGSVGEYIENSSGGSAYGGGVNSITSIDLTAGDWDVSAWCVVGIGTATTTQMNATISASNSGINTPAGAYVIVPGLSNNFSNQAETIGPYRVSLSAPTTYYLNMAVTVTSGSVTVGGLLSARRVR